MLNRLNRLSSRSEMAVRPPPGGPMATTRNMSCVHQTTPPLASRPLTQLCLYLNNNDILVAASRQCTSSVSASVTARYSAQPAVRIWAAADLHQGQLSLLPLSALCSVCKWAREIRERCWKGLIHRSQHSPAQDMGNGGEQCPVSIRLWESTAGWKN